MSFNKAILTVCGAMLFSGQNVSAEVFKATDVHPEGYPNVVAIENMGKKLEAATNGRLSIKMFPNGTLGSR